MSRALRYAPPLTQRGVIVRPRLLAELRGRFERPLTALVAAAGFGKTTLLAQAVNENALSPAGEDVWLTCQRDDAAVSFLAAGTFAAVGVDQAVPDDPRAAASVVAEAIWGAAPRQVALILDDAHWLAPASTGASFLAGLVEELPGNGHLVLASRPPVPLATSRLRATGEAVVLEEPEMQFRSSEVEEFAEARGIRPELLADVGGWPALAELTATVGPHAATGYVWEELLAQLSPERRHALGLLVAVGGADDEIATALLGRPTRLAELLEGLPLVVRGRAGWWSLHGLWATALQHHLDPAEVAEARRRTGLMLARRRQYHDAMDLLLDAGAWEEARHVVVSVCEVCTPLVPPDVLDAWRRRLPDAERAAPEGLLLTAMVAEPTQPARAAGLLHDALDSTGEDDMAVTYACLNALVQLAFWRGDRAEMKSLAQRLATLAERGHAEALSWVALIRALLEPDVERVRAALAMAPLIPGPDTNPVQEWLHAHVVLCRLGDAEQAEALARQSLDNASPTMRAVSRAAVVEALRLQGRLEDAERLLPDLLDGLEPAKLLTSPELVTHAVVVLDLLGRRPEAGQLLARLGAMVALSQVAWAPVAAALARAFHQVSGGTETDARRTLQEVMSLPVPRSQAVGQISSSALPLLYVLVPEVRPVWDRVRPPGALGRLHALVEALVALRERQDVEPLRRLHADSARLAPATLPRPWTAELAAGLAAAGREEEGHAVLVRLGNDARPALRELTRSEHEDLAATARRLLRELPTLPAYRLRLGVLGPLELRRDGVVVNAPELRRERVRQLLGYLLTHDHAVRATVTAELWPDLEPPAAARNLRVTLSYLHHLLEPDRTELDAPYFVRSAGPLLQLTVDDTLVVDVRAFERDLDDAETLERKGVPSEALRAYLRALELWRGDFLADSTTPADWLQWERDRLRTRFVRSAVRAGELLLAGGRPAEAQALAEKVLVSDGWSEPGYQLLVTARLARGDLGGAHRGLRQCLRMLRELGAAPGERTVALGRRLSARQVSAPA